MNKSLLFPAFLGLSYLFVWIIFAINPVSREVWFFEILPPTAIFLALSLTFPQFRFSNTAYTLMSLWIFWHSIGAYYTFANVPFFDDLFSAERNHFDRVGHFMIGLFSFPILEFLSRKKYASPIIASLFALFAIMALAAFYEMVEWVYAVADGGEAGIEVLGSQGDIWDAQKDMLMDTLGAITGIVLFWVLSFGKKK